jgi:transcriptional regulator with XRE-family HTH domain
MRRAAGKADVANSNVPDDADPRVELGSFLRARRERLRPEDLGFPPAGRRRTPGLRREEVAVAAGLSTTWYTYLEQGRGREVSPSVLDSLARVLLLSEDERRYIHILMYGHVPRSEPLDEDIPVYDLVRSLVAIMADYEYPVYSVDYSCNLASWNKSAALWYEDWGQLPEHSRNIMRWMFFSPAARERLADWDSVSRDVVARWRMDVARRGRDAAVADMVAELKAKSPQFAEAWNRPDAIEHRVTFRRLRHPDLGVRDFCIIPVTTVYEEAPWLFIHIPKAAM